MKKRIVVGLVLVFVLISSAGVFAETKSVTYPWMASYEKPGQLNVYASVGWYGFGIDFNVGPEIILGNFDIAGIPLSWGATVRGLLGFGSYAGYTSWIDWGIAPMATLHWGVDFGSPWKFDWYIGLGLSISGTTGEYWNYGSGGIGFGFATADGVAWHFSNNLALILEFAYSPNVSTGGIGIQWKL